MFWERKKNLLDVEIHPYFFGVFQQSSINFWLSHSSFTGLSKVIYFFPTFKSDLVLMEYLKSQQVK